MPIPDNPDFLPGEEIKYFQKEKGDVIDLTSPHLFEDFHVRAGVLAYDTDDVRQISGAMRLAKSRYTFTTSYIGEYKNAPDIFFHREKFWCAHQFRFGFLVEQRKRQITKNLPYAMAERRARKLLRKAIPTELWQFYKKFGKIFIEKDGRYFTVGGYDGVLEVSEANYVLIMAKLLENIASKQLLALDAFSEAKVIHWYCIHAETRDYPQADVVLAQYLMIRDNLTEFERIANIDIGPDHPDYDSARDWHNWPMDPAAAVYEERMANFTEKECVKMYPRRTGPPYLMYDFNHSISLLAAAERRNDAEEQGVSYDDHEKQMITRILKDISVDNLEYIKNELNAWDFDEIRRQQELNRERKKHVKEEALKKKIEALTGEGLRAGW